jgi:aerobic carbon-monoxide dehydrogenase small subunit
MTPGRGLVNGLQRQLPRDGRRLLDWLRDDLGLVVRAACELGQCGACTVLVDGAPVLACCTVAAALVGADIRTVEGLGDDDPVQLALCRRGAVQCGFCATGMVLALAATVDQLTAESTSLDDQTAARRIRAGIAGNVCRCTGYSQMVAAGVDVYRQTVSSVRRDHHDGQRPAG